MFYSEKVPARANRAAEWTMASDDREARHPTSRRGFLRTALAAGGATALVGPAAGAGTPANQPPNVPDWTRSLGDGVAVRKYGTPSKHEAEVIRRDVAWLTATPQSSVSFTPLHELDGTITPNGLCFERHHSGIAEVDPADYRLILHGLVDKPLIFTLDDIKRMPRVSRAYFCECAANSGMEWRGAQLNGAQFTHGMVHCVMYTGVPLKILLEEAGLKPNAKWLLLEGGDAAAMSRSLPLAKALDDALVAYRMNGEMLYPENGYPRADGDTRLGSQHVGEVAAADRSRRRALASPRGNIEIHRSAREWHRPALHLRDGCQVGDHRLRARRLR